LRERILKKTQNLKNQDQGQQHEAVALWLVAFVICSDKAAFPFRMASSILVSMAVISDLISDLS